MSKNLIKGLVIAILMFGVNTYAFNIVGVTSLNTSISKSEVEVNSDLKYLNNIAGKYAHKYVIKKDLNYDASEINAMFSKLTEPLTVQEIDTGKHNYSLPTTIGSKEFRTEMLGIKTLGNFIGLSVEFEPIVAYDIYRDLQIVGGYLVYNTEKGTDVDKLVQLYVKGVQETTKEIVPSTSKPKLKNQINRTLNFIQKDIKLKVFIIKNGKIDSMFERVDG